MTTKQYKRHLVTSALPYANGPIHLGHLAGVYVPSDIYVRYLRRRKRDVISICGSDEHGVPITLKARNEGITPQAVVDRYHAINKKAFEDFGIAFDIYSRTSNKIHHETASEIFRTLYDKGVFIEKTSEQYYDEEAGSLPCRPLHHRGLSPLRESMCLWRSVRTMRHFAESHRPDQSCFHHQRQPACC